MKKRNLAPNNKIERVKRERDPIPWRYCLLTLVCGLTLVGGFFWAARQHFSAIDFGIKNAKLRQMRENLGDEQRRLSLAKEISLSPAEIKKVAKKIGLQDLTARSIELLSPKSATDKNSPKKAADDTPKQDVADNPPTGKVKDDKGKDKSTDDKSGGNKQTASGGQTPQSALNRPRIAKK